jgi:hypothetical protein
VENFDTELFDVDLSKIDSLIDRTRRLPEQVFRRRPYAFRVIDFDEIWTVEFFHCVQSLTRAIGDGRFVVGVIRPDPRDYYFSHFRRYPFIRFSINDTNEGFIRAINEDPGESPADAIAHNSDVVVVHPDQQMNWMVYGDRDLEIGIVAAMSESSLKMITAIFPRERLHSANSAVKQLLSPVYGGAVPEEVTRAFVNNYA